MFSWAKINLLIFFYIVGSALLDTKVNFFFQKFGKYFWGVKKWFVRASCFGFIVKGVCLLLLPLVSLSTHQKSS
jgi:hypothetical protein